MDLSTNLRFLRDFVSSGVFLPRGVFPVHGKIDYKTPTLELNSNFSLLDIFNPPSQLCLDLRQLEKEINISNEYENILTKAFQSEEFNIHTPLIKIILEKMPIEKLNDVLEHLFLEAVKQGTEQELLGKMKRIVQLDRIESCIKISFPNFNNTKETVLTLSNKVKNIYQKEITERNKSVARLILHYFVNALNFLVQATNEALGISQIFEKRKTYMGEDNYRTLTSNVKILRNNFALLGAGLFALASYTKSYVKTAIISSFIAFSTSVFLYIYIKKFKRALNDYDSKDWVVQAALGNLPEVAGRDEEIQELINLLCAKGVGNRRHPLLRGDTGMGKSEIVKGLAHRIASGRVPVELKNKRLIMLNGADLLTTSSGHTFNILNEAHNELEGFESEFIFFIDEVHSVFVGDKNLNNSLKTKLDVNPKNFKYFILATTNKEYEDLIAKDAAFVSRTVDLVVNPTKSNETLAILRAKSDSDAADLIVEEKELQTLADIDKIEQFKNTPQPATSLELLSNAFSDVRHFENSEDKKKLKELRKEEASLESKHKAARGDNNLIYNANTDEIEKLNKIRGEISKLEDTLKAEEKKLDQYKGLIVKEKKVKVESEKEAIRLSELKVQPSTEQHTKFLLKYHFMQRALHKAVEEGKTIHAAKTVVSEDVVKRLIAKKKAPKDPDYVSLA